MGPLWIWLLLWIGSALGVVLIVPGLMAALAAPPPRAMDPQARAPGPGELEAAPNDILEEDEQKFDLRKLALGLSPAVIVELLGPPQSKNMAGAEGENWSYTLCALHPEDPSLEGALLLTFAGGVMVKKTIDRPKKP